MPSNRNEVPPGLTELLNEFTISVLRTYPDNIVKFAKDYFDERYRQTVSDDDEAPLPAMPAGFRNFTRRRSVAAEKYDPSDDAEQTIASYPKTQGQKQKLLQSVNSSFIFNSLEQMSALKPEEVNLESQIALVIGAMKERPAAAGEVIIREGDEEADYYYVVESGTYDIDRAGRVVHTYVDEGSFGELALLYNTPRTATATAKTDGVLWALDRVTFRRLVLKSAYNKRQIYEEFIEAVPILSSLQPHERVKVSDALKPAVFEKDVTIMKTGEKADMMYFVENGEVKIMRAQGDESEVKEVSRIQRGGYFGELGLISKKPRAADVVTTKRTQCATLDVDAFERLLGPCVELMKRNMVSYDADLNKAFNRFE